MRITPLSGSYPLSFDDPTATQFPVFTSFVQSLNSAANIAFNFAPLNNLGDIAFPSYYDDDSIHLQWLSASSANTVPINGNHCTAQGFYLQAPESDFPYLYQVSGSLVDAYNTSSVSVTGSVIVAHAASTFNTSSVSARILHEHPLGRVNYTSGSTITNHAFNFSLYDSGHVPLPTSRLYFGFMFRTNSSSAAILKPSVCRLNVWRMRAPVRVNNDWQA